MELKIKSVLIENSSTEWGFPCTDSTILFQKTKKEFKGDATLVLFPLLKIAGKSPAELATLIGEYLKNKVQLIEDYSVVGGFLNLEYPKNYWFEELKGINQTENYGFGKKDSKPEIMVEYSSPNTNKPLHLGHLRNNFLGYSVAQILEASGHKVVKTQIINDRGIHICKSMLAWQKFSPINEKGERETPENTGLKGDKLVGKYYVEFDKHFNAEAKEIIEQLASGKTDTFSAEVVSKFNELNEAKIGKDEKTISDIDAKIKELAKNETSLLKEAKQMLVKWEAKDSEIYALWQKMNSWVYAGFNETYAKMGVQFDRLYFESETYILGKDLVQEGLEKGVFYQKDDQSVWIDLTAEGLDHKLLLRSDGTSVYMTQDVGTAVDRFKDYSNLSGIIYTVGNEQDYHFKVLFLILDKLGYSWAKNCFHLSYGMVDLPTGKMKSREGTVVDADDLMDEVIASAKEMTLERGHLDGLSADEKETLYKNIGLGGLKYYLLKVDPRKRMLFNPEESIELNGNTGPFIQYTHARIQSLLQKVTQVPTLEMVEEIHPSELEIIKKLLDFPTVIQQAADELAPSHIANYAYDLVKLYNQFYQQLHVLNEENDTIRAFRICLSKNVGKVIKNSLHLLGIQAPNKM
ncbi:MAG TPA: arginine--tRNA ligase [Fluviicola sp.]|nr:arginine--tRNA ligase [Fluviicola sp.]